MSIPLSTQGSAPNMGEYASKTLCTWCDGCGDYGIWTATKQALVQSGIHPWQAVLCYDIGCHGNGADKIQGYRAHTLHGRVIPFAAGVTLANPHLKVMAFGGDGATFSEGVGHLVHAVRSHYPMVFVLHNNANYGLTTGQASSLTWKNQPMNSSPFGIPEETLPSMDFVFSLQPTFVARGFSGNIPQLTEIFAAALAHRGFAFVDVLQACPTYNPFATHEYLLERCYEVSGEGHDPSDFAKARALATDTSTRIATGILYRTEEIPHFLERLEPRKGVMTMPVEEVRKFDIAPLLKEFV